NIFRRAVILLQANHFGLGKIVFEIENIADIRAAPAINRLVFVAHHAEIFVGLGKQAHELVLAAIGVLIFVHHHIAQPSIPRFAGSLIGLQQVYGFQQQVVEIQRVGVAERLFVILVHRRQGFAFLIRCAFVKILRGFFGIFSAADARQRYTILQELLLV